MGCSSSMPAWEAQHTETYVQLKLTTIWTRDKYSTAAGLKLTVTRDEEEGTGTERLLTLDGGYVFVTGAKCHPSDAIITAANGDMKRAVVGLKQHDTWSWTLQGSRSLDGPDGSDVECSICMSPFYQPVRFPTHEDAGPATCGHIFCRGCVVRCLAGGQICCPLCRAPLAKGMTAATAKHLPTDQTIATETVTTAFQSKPFTINGVTPAPTTVWTAPALADDDRMDGTTTLPKTITVRRMGGRIRAWLGSSPKSLAKLPENERSNYLGFASTAARRDDDRPLHPHARNGSRCGFQPLAYGVEAGPRHLLGHLDRAVLVTRRPRQRSYCARVDLGPNRPT